MTVAETTGVDAAVAERFPGDADAARGVRSLLLVGVGGQGVVLSSAIIAEALLNGGFDVKQSEVHGMSQRGGSVFSHLRFGETVESPLVPRGGAEVIVGFEWAEVLRWLPYLKPGGAVIADLRTIVPPGACQDRRGWSRPYPMPDPATIEGYAGQVRLLDATGTAAELGNAKAANSVLVGAAAELLDVPEADWAGAIERRVPPKTIEVNLAAFEAGRTLETAQVDEATRTSLAGGAATVAPPSPAGEIDINEAWCKGCHICSRICPENCLALDTTRQVVLAVDPEACTACRLCEMLCPDFAIEIHSHPIEDEDATRSDHTRSHEHA